MGAKVGMAENFRKIFGKGGDVLRMEEHFELRRKRVSMAFVLIILVTVALLAPVCFFVLKSPVAAGGTSLIGVLALVAAALVLSDRDRLGCALLLSGVGLILAGILAAAHRSPDYPSVLVSIVVLGMIVLMPSGAMVSGGFALGMGIFFAAAINVFTTLSAVPELQGRRAVVGVAYLIGALIIGYLTRLQDRLLNQSVSEWKKSSAALESVERLMSRLGTLKKEADSSGTSISNSFDAVEAVMEAFSGKSSGLDDAARRLGETSAGARDNLDSLVASVESISAAVARQKQLADEHSASQERMAAAFESIRSDVTRADEATKRLASLAEEGKGTLETTIAGVKGLADYQAKTLEIVGTLAKISNQTNLLAMNAAIEAAHAGSAGAGFAVVAESVRDLADSSGVRTKEIGGIVKAMNGEIVASAARIETVAASMFQVIEDAASSYRLIANIARTMDSFARDSRAALQGVRALAELANAIKADADGERSVAASFAETFASLSRSFETISEGIADLKAYADRSAGLLSEAARAKAESESVNRAIDGLLGEGRAPAAAPR